MLKQGQYFSVKSIQAEPEVDDTERYGLLLTRSQVQTRRVVIQIEVFRDSSQPLQGFKSGRDHFPPQPLSHLCSLQSCQVPSQEHLTAVP